MGKHKIKVCQGAKDKWFVEVFEIEESIVCYGGIDTENDAYLIGEAFIDGVFEKEDKK